MPELEEIKPAVTATNAPMVTIELFDEKKEDDKNLERENVTNGK
jgi:hypothetical protein